jgi:hypothetical protein
MYLPDNGKNMGMSTAASIRRRVETLLRKLQIAIAPRREITRLERLAEAAYTAMYDTPRYGIRDCYDDAQGYLCRVIELAERVRLKEIVTRLKLRKDHIYSVYDRQFR